MKVRSQPGQIVPESLSQKNSSQKMTGGVAQGVGLKKKKKEKKKSQNHLGDGEEAKRRKIKTIPAPSN
jgi:hypothetical protein